MYIFGIFEGFRSQCPVKQETILSNFRIEFLNNFSGLHARIVKFTIHITPFIFLNLIDALLL